MASVHEVVNSILDSGELWIASRSDVACFVNGPSPDRQREEIATEIFESSLPEEYAQLKLIKIHQDMV